MYYKLRRIYDFFRRDILYGIRNLIIWFPIIWNDRNSDQHYIYIILHHKLKLMEKVIRNGKSLNCEKDADRIKICKLLLDRLIKDEYVENASKLHDKKWGKGIFSIKNDYFDIIYENIENKKDEEKQRKDFKKYTNHVNYMIKQDLDMLFKLMRKYIEYWWD